MLKNLEEPPPVDSLEVESRDLVKARLDLVIEEPRQLHLERLAKKKESLKQATRQETLDYLFRLEEQKSCICLTL